VGPPGGPPVGPLEGPPGGPPLVIGPIVPPAPQGFHNGRLTGNPLTAFDGNQSCSRDFMDEWNLYYLNNRFNAVFATPFQRVAHCLTYIKGPKVADWNRMQVRWLNNITTRNVNPVDVADPWLWDTFTQAFLQAYTDTVEEEYTKRKLKNLRMKPGQLDDYIVEFDNLIQLTGQ
jgi:Retrotransposon gag protein